MLNSVRIKKTEKEIEELMNMKFKLISITLCQQGGIGLLPRIVKIDRWYSILDSQDVRPSEFFWDNTEIDRYHSQGWALRQYTRLARRITQKEVEQKMEAILEKENGQKK